MDDNINTLNKRLENTIYIKKSKFITLIYHINNLEEVEIILKAIRKEFKKADHYCYAYIIGEIKKSNNDGEPNGTAGIPILSTLEQLKQNMVLGVVIRYLGGIKLGTGGLTRAYRNSIKECLTKKRTKSFF